MKTKSLKLKTILTLSVAVVCMFCAFAFTSISPAKANTNVVFEMNTQAQARIADPSGIRFVAKMNEATKNAVQSQGSEFGFLIAPSVYFTDQVVSAGKYHDSFAVSGAEYKGLYDFVDVQYKTENSAGTNDFDKITASTKEDGVYLANGVLANIKEANLDLDFSAVAYYKTSGDTEYTYADLNISELKKNIHSIVSKEYLNAELPADTEMLVDAFNIGSDTANGDKPAMSVLLTDEADFSAMLAKQDTAWYQLANDITIAQAQEGTPNYSYDTTLTSILDGNGHKLSIAIEYSTTASDQQLYKGIVNEISGTVKNIIISSEITGLTNDGVQSVLCKTLNGTVKDTAFITKYTFTGALSMYNGLFETLGENSVVSNVLNLDVSSGKTIMLAISAHEKATIENFVFIGKSYNGGKDGYGNYYWRRFPNYGGGDNMPNVSGIYAYESADSAMAGTNALHPTGYITEGQDPNKANGQGDVYDFTLYNGNRDICITETISKPINTILSGPFAVEDGKIMFDNTVVYPVKIVEINNKADFISAMRSGESNLYNLNTNIELTGEDDLNKTTFFGTSFNGILNGNGYKVSISDYSLGVYFWGLFTENNGVISNVEFDIDLSGVPAVTSGANGMGIIAQVNNGTLKNSIIAFTRSETNKSSEGLYKLFNESNGTIQNCVYIVKPDGWARITGSLSANAVVEDIVVIAPYKKYNTANAFTYLMGSVSVETGAVVEDIYYYENFANADAPTGKVFDHTTYLQNPSSYTSTFASSPVNNLWSNNTTVRARAVVSGFTFTADGASFTK